MNHTAKPFANTVTDSDVDEALPDAVDTSEGSDTDIDIE